MKKLIIIMGLLPIACSAVPRVPHRPMAPRVVQPSATPLRWATVGVAAGVAGGVFIASKLCGAGNRAPQPSATVPPVSAQPQPVTPAPRPSHQPVYNPLTNPFNPMNSNGFARQSARANQFAAQRRAAAQRPVPPAVVAPPITPLEWWVGVAAVGAVACAIAAEKYWFAKTKPKVEEQPADVEPVVDATPS